MAAIDWTLTGRPQGWCPRCSMKSVVVSDPRFVCTSPQCAWDSNRTSTLENRIFSQPTLSNAKLDLMRETIGVRRTIVLDS